jgi:hypothetical protein
VGSVRQKARPHFSSAFRVSIEIALQKSAWDEFMGMSNVRLDPIFFRDLKPHAEQLVHARRSKFTIRI